jgi:hypothetical protein
MKKKNQKSALTLLIVYAFLFLCFISTMIAHAQTDSSQVANGASAMAIVSQIANILPAPWGQIVSALSMLAAVIIPLIQKSRAKKKATAVVKAVLDANPTLPQKHADSLKSLTK